MLHAFSGTDGSGPDGGLVQGSDGAFYGTTTLGGASSAGTVFRITDDGSSFSVLHTFSGTDGRYPEAALVQASDGTFYGTTRGGGASDLGTVFQVSADGSTFSVVHSFDAANGSVPLGSVVPGADGALYGTTSQGGTSNSGTVFRITADGSSFSVLHSFNGTDGNEPSAGLVLGPDGAFYGTASQGGVAAYGTVFRITADGSSFSVLSTFDAASGLFPAAGLLQGSDGALYGTTISNVPLQPSRSTVLRVSADGSSFSVLHSFNGTDGRYPYGRLVQGSDGFLYGTTSHGGASNCGTVFRITADGLSFSVLHSFDGTDGCGPVGGLVQGLDGTLYGTTQSDGTSDYGTIFKIRADGSSFSILHRFDGTNGRHPQGDLVPGWDGAFYGTTCAGGASGLGTVFRIASDGSAFSVLHSFDGFNGSSPERGGLVQGSDGAFYGAACGGGAFGKGIVFRVTADGSYFSALHTFDGTDGGCPAGGLLQRPDGAFYGTTFQGGAFDYGSVFRITADGSAFSVLHSFNLAGGTSPSPGLAQDADGAFYGTAMYYGPAGGGVVFRLGVLLANDQSVSTDQNVATPITLDATDPNKELASYALVSTPDHGSLSGTVPNLTYTPAPNYIGLDRFTFKVIDSHGSDSNIATVSIAVSGSKGIQFTRPVFTASEPSSSAVVVAVTRTGQTSTAATVDYGTTDGTARAGVDYIAKTGQLSFAPGVVTKTFGLALLPSTIYDGNESFLLHLSNPQGPGAELGFQHTAVVAITDRNPVPTLQFSAATYPAIEGGPAAKITVVRSGSLGVPVTVSFATIDGTATAPGDYTSTTGILSFAVGVATRTFSVAITNDSIPEPNESLGLLLSSPGGGAILGTRSKATLTIRDNDQAVQFSAATYTVSEASAKAIVSVKRTGGTSGTVWVDYATGAGTATAGSDYQATSGTLTFGPGVATRTFGVPILNDTLDEGSETVPLTLSNPSPREALGLLATATLTILDNEPAVQFSAASYVASEPPARSMRNVLLTVRRIGGATGTVHVNYATTPGTAVPGVDYSETAGQLTFLPGTASQTFAVTLLGNDGDERKPTVNLALTRVDIPLGTPSTAVLTIANNDVAGTAQLAAVAFSGLASTGSATIAVTRTGGTADASVQYTTSDGTAVSGVDYTGTTGTVAFGPGETTKSFTVPVAPTGLPNKYFLVTLRATVGNLGLGRITSAPVWIIE